MVLGSNNNITSWDESLSMYSSGVLVYVNQECCKICSGVEKWFIITSSKKVQVRSQAENEMVLLKTAAMGYILRAGQDQGGPRWDTLTKKSKSTKLLHIVLCYTQGVAAYDPVLFGGCITPPLTPLQVKPEALILISIGGRTLQCGVMYIFYVLVLPKLTFVTYCGIGKSKDL